jgi:hypothetical protein
VVAFCYATDAPEPMPHHLEVLVELGKLVPYECALGWTQWVILVNFFAFLFEGPFKFLQVVQVSLACELAKRLFWFIIPESLGLLFVVFGRVCMDVCDNWFVVNQFLLASLDL